MNSKLNLPENNNFGYLDTETTGTSSNDQVVEVSLIGSDGSILFNTLIKPTVPVNPFAYKVHKIGSDELQNSPSWNDVCDQFNKIASSLDAIYIYNEPFDKRLLSQSYAAHGQEMPSLNLVCAHKLAKAWMKKNGFDTSKSNLDLFCQRAGASLDGIVRHRALGDCILMKRAFDAVELGSSSGLSDNAPVGRFSENSISSTISVDARQHIKDVIDSSLYDGIGFAEYVEKLKAEGVRLIPVLGDENNPDFNACYYSYNQSKFPGSRIGKTYSAPQLVKRGLRFDPNLHGDLIRKLFFKGKLDEQKEIFLDLGEKVLGNEYAELMNLTWPVKSKYNIRQRSRVAGTKVNAIYSSFDINEKFSHRGQYAINENNPKSIRLRELSFNNVKISLDYSEHLDKTPSIVRVETNTNSFVIKGDMCMNRAMTSLDQETFNIAANYFKGNIESEIYSIQQDLFCGFERKKVASLTRYADSATIDQCALIPNLKELKEQDYESQLTY